jgi:autotransporter-associated beta strand protein
MKPNRSLIPFLGIITLSMLGAAGLANAQTWTSTASGNWNDGANWDSNPAVPASASTTAVKFFATPGTVIPAASAVVANQDIAAPMILNSLTVNGTGPGSGTAPSLTISGGAIQFAGTSPALNVNAGYGTVGYTVNLNSNLDFSADTAINFSGGGAFINVGGAVTFAGAGKVTFTGGLINRPLSLLGVGTFTGDLVLNGSSSVLQLNKNSNILGTNAATTQSVTVAGGSGVNLAYGNAAYGHPQNFVVNGDGNSATSNAAVNASRINFGNGSIGGLALATDATVRTAPEIASEARGVTTTRGIVGTGKLIKTGGGYLFPNVASPASVTWGGTEFSAYTGNVEIREGVIQTPAISNALGSNTATTQRVTVSPGAAMAIGAGNNAWTQPQNFILNGNGTGYVANNGGFAALDSYGAGFGNNTVRRIVVATDSTISARRDASSSGLGRGLTTQAGLAGTGTLTINGPYGSAISPVYFGTAASAFEEFPAFSGKVIINNGILNIGNTDALGASPAAQVTLNGLGALSSSLSGGLNQAFLDRIENLATTSGAVCLGNASANDLDFTSAPNLRLGAINNFTYTGTLTPAGGIYRLGGGGGTLTVSSLLTGSTSVVISGSVVLSNASNDFNGGVTIASNNTGLGQTASLGFTGGTGNLNGNAITFGGAGGTLAYTGGASGSSDSLGALSFPTGHCNVTSTKGAAGNTFLTFSSMTARSAGATGNFTVSGGTNGTDNKITVTSLATGFVDKGVFFGGANYAFNDAAGFLRAPVYGTDAGFVTSGSTTSVAGVAHQQITGALTAQNSESFTTLKIAGAHAITLASGQTLTVDGILKTGATATISGGNGIQASSNSEMVVRIDASGDAMTIGAPILANGTSSLTKTGAGSLTLTLPATYTGGTTVVAGTFLVGSTSGLEDGSTVTVNGGTYSTNSSTDTVGTVTLKNGVIGGTGIHQGSSYAVENGMVTARLGGSGALTKTTAGQVILAGANSYTGGTTISGGTLTVSRSGSLDDSGSIAISGGATYELGGLDLVGDVTLIDGTIRGPGALDALSYAVSSGRIEAPLAGAGTITKSTGGTVTLTGVNTAVSDVVVNAGTLVLADNAKLNFAVNGLSATSITGAGTVTLDGDFGIDLSLADLTPGNAWTLVDAATLAETFGTTFSIPGFTEAANVWTKVDGLNKWTFTEATGVLKLSLAGFSSWITGFGLSVGDQDPEDDPDFDGINNLMEYVLFNGHPNMPSTSIVPTLDAGGANFVFTFYRRNDSTTDTTQIFQHATDLSDWTPVAIPGGAGVTVTPDTPSLGIDKVEISVVKGANTKLFGRLKVTQP